MRRRMSEGMEFVSSWCIYEAELSISDWFTTFATALELILANTSE